MRTPRGSAVDLRVTAGISSGSEPAFYSVSGLIDDEASPERSLAAAVLVLALSDATRKASPTAFYGNKSSVVSEARTFLTACHPSPWALRRQLFTDILGLDDEAFRQAVIRKLEGI